MEEGIRKGSVYSRIVRECRKHGGGIHCSTLPLVRERD